MKKSLISMLVLCIMIAGIISYNNRIEVMDLGDELVPLAPGYQFDSVSQKVVDDLAAVEQMVAELAGTDDVHVINHGTLAFIRSKKYGYRTSGMSRLVWNGYAGAIDKETGIDVVGDAAEVEKILKLTDQMAYINDPEDGSPIDFPHMIAVVDVEYTDREEDPVVEEYTDFLLTWGGDLETFLLDMNDYSDASGKSDYDSMYVFAEKTLASDTNSYFSLEDYNADLDGVNLEMLMRRDGLLISDAIEAYYLSGMFMQREQLFVMAHGGQASMEEAVRAFVLGEVPERLEGDENFALALDSIISFNDMMRSMAYDQKYDPTDTTRQAASDAFLAKVLQGNYVANR